MPTEPGTPANPLLAYGSWLATCPAQWPAEAIESARRQFIDCIAVTVPGALESATRKVLAAVASWGDGQSSAAGHQPGLAAPWAALVNGTAAHALDFDDNFDPPKAHATAVLAPALLALGEETGASGKNVIDAYIAGLQVMGRVGQGLNPVHRNRGWHATATVGAIGAAAACARLERLGPQESAHALSLATSMAGGFMAQFGTMAKPLHAGLAAKAGIMAARLAQAGVDASLDALDGPTGMQALMVGPDHAQLRDALTHIEHGQTLCFETASVGDPLLILEHGFRVKRYPVCGSAHRAMDGLLELRETYGLLPARIARIDVHAPASHLTNLMYPAPKTPLEAKFSLEYGLATVLLQGSCRLGDFTDSQVMRANVRALYPRIHRHPVDLPESAFPTRVEVTCTDGRLLSATVAMPQGSIASPFPITTYWGKFEDCTRGLMMPADQQKLRDALEHLPDLADISTLAAPMRGITAAGSD